MHTNPFKTIFFHVAMKTSCFETTTDWLFLINGLKFDSKKVLLPEVGNGVNVTLSIQPLIHRC